MLDITLSLPYGSIKQVFTISEINFAGSLCPQFGQHSEPMQLLKEALQHPVNSTQLQEFIQNKRILIIVNDASRATPTDKIISFLQTVIPFDNIEFLVAVGSHRSQKEEDLKQIFGQFYEMYRKKIRFHDSHSPSSLVTVGISSFGNEILLNHSIQKADGILVIGSVEPHYFAGFTGGRKSFLPGIAGFESITRNHKLALSKGVNPLALHGNPVHEEMDSVLAMIEVPIFSIQTVLDCHDEIVFAAAGCIRRSFQLAVEASRSLYAIPVEEKADIIVASVTPPLDGSLYQAHKAIENTRQVLKDDGILILVAPCQNGVGDNPGFVEILSESESPKAAMAFAEENYQLGYHKVARLAELMEKAQLWAVSELSEHLLNRIFFRGFNSLQGAVDSALALKPDAKILVVEAAGMTVPYLND